MAGIWLLTPPPPVLLCAPHFAVSPGTPGPASSRPLIWAEGFRCVSSPPADTERGRAAGSRLAARILGPAEGLPPRPGSAVGRPRSSARPVRAPGEGRAGEKVCRATCRFFGSLAIPPIRKRSSPAASSSFRLSIAGSAATDPPNPGLAPARLPPARPGPPREAQLPPSRPRSEASGGLGRRPWRGAPRPPGRAGDGANGDPPPGDRAAAWSRGRRDDQREGGEDFRSPTPPTHQSAASGTLRQPARRAAPTCPSLKPISRRVRTSPPTVCKAKGAEGSTG